jgi:hypothetical protein
MRHTAGRCARAAGDARLLAGELRGQWRGFRGRLPFVPCVVLCLVFRSLC